MLSDQPVFQNTLNIMPKGKPYNSLLIGYINNNDTYA